MNRTDPDQPVPMPATTASTPQGDGPPPAAEPDTAELLEQLRRDRLWLLRQIDGGCWPRWRLDLAALERELGQLLEKAGDQLGPS